MYLVELLETNVFNLRIVEDSLKCLPPMPYLYHLSSSVIVKIQTS